MSTITLNLLAQKLAGLSGITEDEATKKLLTYFNKATDDLINNRKTDLGSVGILTVNGDGEVSFTPSTRLAAAVNTPFAMFEAMPLNDGELSDEYIPDALATATQSTTQTQMPDSPAQKAPQTMHHQTTSDIHVPEKEDVNDSQDAYDNIEDAPGIMTDSPVIANNIALDEDVVLDENIVSTNDTHRKRCGVSVCATFMLCLICAIVFFALGTYTGLNIQKWFKVNWFVPEEKSVPVCTTSTSPEKHGAKETHGAKDLTQPVDTAATDTATMTKSPENQQASKPVSKPARYDKVGTTTFLTTLARRYYGQMEYWVYIYDANDLGHPNRIKPETSVRIPYPEELPLTGDKERDIQTARKHADEIYARYN